MTNTTKKEFLITKANGQKEVFDEKKLENSLLRSGASEENIKKIIKHVYEELTEDTTTFEIYKHAFSILHKLEKAVANRYSLRRAVMDLGPTGFTFEKFISEIFKRQGFNTETDQTVQGSCVSHEIDVVAYNKEKLIMVEAKFHNELGIKSDLKVVLYVKARYDDLKDVIFDYGGKRKLDEGWLMTNTKFSSTAINYALCQGMTLVGWNYPEVGNLQDLIEETGVYPITCLNTISGSQKKQLIEKGIVMCRDLKENKDMLNDVGVSKEDMDDVIEEINYFNI